MLMDCLAEGRAISLPAGAIAIGKLSVAAVGAYARIRKQFKVPIAELEGVQVSNWARPQYLPPIEGLRTRWDEVRCARERH